MLPCSTLATRCGGASLAYIPVCVRALPLRPRCCRPNRSMWKREDVVVGQCTFTHSSVLHNVTGSESGSRRRYTTHTACTRCALRQLPSLKNTLYKESQYNGRRKAFTSQGHHTIYNDDVNSGPRPKAHWYMLTH